MNISGTSCFNTTTCILLVYFASTFHVRCDLIVLTSCRNDYLIVDVKLTRLCMQHGSFEDKLMHGSIASSIIRVQAHACMHAASL